MIHNYFTQLEQYIQDFPLLRSYTLTHKVYNAKQGFIRGILIFEDGTQLEFVEVANTDLIAKIKYRYHYMNQNKELIFRYDNAPHHPGLRTFPHHIHLADEVREHDEISLNEVLLEVAKHIRRASTEGDTTSLK